jgi:dCMP deaminase
MSSNKLNEIINLLSSWDKSERLSWDEYFLATAFLISSRSPDQRLKVGCVLVKDEHIISVGYNGFLPKLEHQSYIDNGHEQATVHAEQNCISDCAKRGVKTEGAIAYITHYPCINCFKILASSGIQTIYYKNDYRNYELVGTLANQANINIIKLF